MTRTNIEIDDDLVTRVMRRYGLTTKRAAVDLALRRAAGPQLRGPALVEAIRAVSGTGWDADPAIFDVAHEQHAAG